MENYLSVSSLTQYLKLKFDKDPYLERVYLTGEVSGFRERQRHQYFSLKDDKAVIKVTMWQGVFRKLGFSIEEGMKINVIGHVEIYPPSGSYSLIIDRAEPDGIGALAVKFEQLKKKLTAEGLFDSQWKQKLPTFPKKIGVVTSRDGSVIRDIMTTVTRRFPGVSVVLFPTKVQGAGSAEMIAKNIARANERADLDVLIIGRGGGSIEDLWCFNEEVVVRAIFESRLPIISSVGHETDTTLSDFAADQRAATPTAAAELATPVEKIKLYDWLSDQQTRLRNATTHRIQAAQEQLHKAKSSVFMRQPERLYDIHEQRFDKVLIALKTSMKHLYQENRQQYQLLTQGLQSMRLTAEIDRYQQIIAHYQSQLQKSVTYFLDKQQSMLTAYSDALVMLDTSRIVKRGYAIVKKKEQVIASVEGLAPKDQITIEMSDGQIEVEVEDVRKNKNI